MEENPLMNLFAYFTFTPENRTRLQNIYYLFIYLFIFKNMEFAAFNQSQNQFVGFG